MPSEVSGQLAMRRAYWKTAGLSLVNFLLISLIATLGCNRYPANSGNLLARDGTEPWESKVATGFPLLYSFQVVNSFPHDKEAFTQGLIFHDGVLYESTGLNGRSSIRRVELTTGRILNKADVGAQFFGEGMTIFNGKIYQLTWKSGKGFIYDEATLARIGEFGYGGEGWGLTHDDSYLIMSDGSNSIRFLDPATLNVARTISVSSEGKPVDQLNELEYIKGEIFANVWQTNMIARIDPVSGNVKGWIDLKGLLPAADHTPETDVLNGIAYDVQTDRLFVTGKLWPRLFEIRIVGK
jgi:glutamine cyclotransferase